MKVILWHMRHFKKHPYVLNYITLLIYLLTLACAMLIRRFLPWQQCQHYMVHATGAPCIYVKNNISVIQIIILNIQYEKVSFSLELKQLS